MELLIFSDSHGRAEGIEMALKRQIRSPMDGIFFLGDGLRDIDAVDTNGATVYRVAGNCDWFMPGFMGEMPPTEWVTALEGHTIFLTHGHRFGVKGGYGALLSRAVSVGADIVLFGHTHIPFCQMIPKGETVGDVLLTRPLYLFNPGSVGMNADGGGRCYGTLLLRGETVLFSHGRV